MKRFSKFVRPRHNPSTKSDEPSIADVVEKEALAAADVVRSRAIDQKDVDKDRAMNRGLTLDKWYNMRAEEAKLPVEVWHNARRNVINKQIELEKLCYRPSEGAKMVYDIARKYNMSDNVAMDYARKTYETMIKLRIEDQKRYEDKENVFLEFEKKVSWHVPRSKGYGYGNGLPENTRKMFRIGEEALRREKEAAAASQKENDEMSAGGSGKRKSKRNRPGKKQRKRTNKKRTNKKRTNKK